VGIFGWSMPPGCSHQDIDRAVGLDQPCEVCGNMEDDCICKPCPKCHVVGDPKCFRKHKMKMSKEQIIGLAWNEAIWEDDARVENNSLSELYKEIDHLKEL
jgi:hypothetical protein